MVKVLFVCVHNAARSQMAEAFLNRLGEGKFEAQSAGLEVAPLNPIVVDAMREIGYDISNNSTDSVFDFFKQGRLYNVVIKVCDQMHGQKCPIFPMVLKNLDWNLQDPSELEGTYEEKLAGTRVIRDLIKAKVESFVGEYS